MIFTTRAGLAVHHNVIEILHIIGARDGYIARQFAAPGAAARPARRADRPCAGGRQRWSASATPPMPPRFSAPGAAAADLRLSSRGTGPRCRCCRSRRPRSPISRAAHGAGARSRACHETGAAHWLRLMAAPRRRSGRCGAAGLAWFVGWCRATRSPIPPRHRRDRRPDRRQPAGRERPDAPGRGQGEKAVRLRRLSQHRRQGLLRASSKQPERLTCCIELGHEADSTRGNAPRPRHG